MCFPFKILPSFSLAWLFCYEHIQPPSGGRLSHSIWQHQPAFCIWLSDFIHYILAHFMHNVLFRHSLLTYSVYYIKPSFKNVLCIQGKYFEKTNPDNGGKTAKSSKPESFQQFTSLFIFFPDILGLSPRELGQTFKSETGRDWNGPLGIV